MELYWSVLTCQGLFATLRERFQYVPSTANAAPAADEMAKPGREDSLGLPRYYDYAGAVHVHSTYSDGAGTVKEIADAANQAGLDFVVLCDHSSLEARTDGEDGWRGRSLMIVGTEVTTEAGHLLALDVPESFLPASNDARTAQAQIVDSGGVGFIALPCDLKDHWRDYSQRDERMGLEVFNLSAIARTKINIPGLALVWSRYKSNRPNRAFHLVAARPDRELKLWDALITGGPLPASLGTKGSVAKVESDRKNPDGSYQVVVGIGSIDAHGIMKFGGKSYYVPTYTDVFRTLRTHILLDAPLIGSEFQEANPIIGEGSRATRGDMAPDTAGDQGRQSADVDTAAVHGALARGHSYIAYDNYADSTGFLFECVTNAGRSLMGDSINVPVDGATYRLRVRCPKTRSFIRLYRDGKPVAAARGGALDYVSNEPGAYRVEAYLYKLRLGNLCLGAKPWIFSNPLYIQPVGVNLDSKPANVAKRPESV